MQVAVLKRLRAENIVRLLGVCLQGGTFMLVTEYMAGGDLWSILRDSQKYEELLWYRK